MKLFIPFAVATIMLACFFCRAQSQKQEGVLCSAYMRAMVHIKGFSGSVLVMKHGKVVLEKGYGFSNRAKKIPNTAFTKFKIASVTKQFTAACVLQLAEQGKLNLGDKLSRYIPGYPKGDSVTVDMLLHHTSGIPDFTHIAELSRRAGPSWTTDSILYYFEGAPYDFSPGTQYRYSNSGYFILGYIIEKVSGQAYREYLKQHILDKAGMGHSGTYNEKKVPDGQATGYNKASTGGNAVAEGGLDRPFSAGNMYSTIRDLYNWDRALYGNTILATPYRQKMLAPGLGNYGCGVIIDTFFHHLRIHHDGGIPGFVSQMERFVNDDICIVVLSNNESNAVMAGDVLAAILLGERYELPYIPKEIALDSAAMARFTGRYTGPNTMQVLLINHALYRRREGLPDFELRPESPSRFFFTDGSERTLEFISAPDGKVTGARIIAGVTVMEYVKAHNE